MSISVGNAHTVLFVFLQVYAFLFSVKTIISIPFFPLHSK